jgi:hypothetical protein
MLNENTEEVLVAWGADIVKFARINIGDRNRKRRSKMTGKMRKGKIDSTGDLRKSLADEIVINPNSFGFKIVGEDYALDVDQGNVRKTSPEQVGQWMKDKRIRLTNKKGFVKMTEARIEAFKKFVSWKVSNIGSDRTNYMTDAIKEASLKHEADLIPSLFKDIEQATSLIIKQLQ